MSKIKDIIINKIGVIITAGGNGLRMNSAVRKQYLKLKDKPILYYSIKKFYEFGFEKIVVTLPAEDIEQVQKEILEKYSFNNVVLVSGSVTRQESVFNGILKMKKHNIEYLFVHDAVRPLINKKLIENMLTEFYDCEGLIPVLPVTDTIKLIKKNNYIDKTMNRNDFVLVQTPQLFLYKIIYDCYIKSKNNLSEFTDDASLLEKYNKKIKFINGLKQNIKITVPEDLKTADFLLT